MKEHNAGLFILGGTGFVGKEVVKEAIARGFQVKVLVRDRAKAAELADAGAILIPGDATTPAEWIGEAAKSKVLIDLVQPQLPERIGLSAIRSISATRVANTRKLVSALETLPADDRPLLMSVSGLDDLAPDAEGRVRDHSPLRDQPVGFAHIGIPVRRVIEASQLASTFVYLGTVYGPGKTFASKIFPQLAAGKFRIPGDGANRMPLIHLEDAARALVHLAAQPAAWLTGRSFVAADGADVTMRNFLGSAAEQLGGPAPGSLPLWLVRLVLGSVLSETLTRDISARPDGLLASGFVFRYRSSTEGLPPTLERLALPKPPARPSHRAARLPRVPFWALFMAAIGALLSENLLDFPLSVPAMTRLAGGLPLLDMRPWYSAPAAYHLFDTLGAQGRSAYLHLLWSVDLLLPLLFGWFLSEAIARGRFSRLKWIPVLAAATDYAENVAITILLLRYPNPAPAIVWLSAALTALKLSGYLSSVLLAVIGNVGRIAGVCRRIGPHKGSLTGTGPCPIG